LPGGPGDKGSSAELQALQQVIDEVKVVVRYVKKSGLNATIQKSVVQENDTRWNSMLMMLESVLAQERELKEALQIKEEGHRIDTIDFSPVCWHSLQHSLNHYRLRRKHWRAIRTQRCITLCFSAHNCCIT